MRGRGGRADRRDARRGGRGARGRPLGDDRAARRRPRSTGASRPPPLRDAVPWEPVQLWWGDDRFVPRDHPLSNVHVDDVRPARDRRDERRIRDRRLRRRRLAGRSAGAPIPAGERPPVPDRRRRSPRAQGPDWARASATRRSCARPGRRSRTAGRSSTSSSLGIGPDGHILSVFPGSAAFDSDEPVLGDPGADPHRAARRPGDAQPADRRRARRRSSSSPTARRRPTILGAVLGAERDERRLPGPARPPRGRDLDPRRGGRSALAPVTGVACPAAGRDSRSGGPAPDDAAAIADVYLAAYRRDVHVPARPLRRRGPPLARRRSSPAARGRGSRKTAGGSWR